VNNLLFLNKKEIEACLSVDRFMDKIEDAYMQSRKGNYCMPLRSSIEVENKTILYMPCVAERLIGTKLLTIFPDNHIINKPILDGLMVLNDFETGETTALLDGKTLTSIRTGAVGGVAVKYLSRKDCTSLGVIGAGPQGFYQVLFACRARKIRKVYIYDAFVSDLTAFINNLKYMLKDNKIEFIECKKVEELLENSEIVITATPSNLPVIPNKKELLEGKCYIGIGSYKPNMKEYPNAIWSLANNVFIDSEFAIEESGDISQPLKEGILTKDRIKLFSDLINSDEKHINGETTFFKSVGMALFDLYIGDEIYKIALENNVGQKINC